MTAVWADASAAARHSQYPHRRLITRVSAGSVRPEDGRRPNWTGDRRALAAFLLVWLDDLANFARCCKHPKRLQVAASKNAAPLKRVAPTPLAPPLRRRWKPRSTTSVLFCSAPAGRSRGQGANALAERRRAAVQQAAPRGRAKTPRLRCHGGPPGKSARVLRSGRCGRFADADQIRARSAKRDT